MGSGHSKAHVPATHRIPHCLDALPREKTRSRLAEGLPFSPILMTGAAPEVDIFAIGAIIVAAMAAAEVIDRLSGEGFRGETGPGYDDLAVFVLISGVCGLESGHELCFREGRLKVEIYYLQESDGQRILLEPFCQVRFG